MVKNKKNPNPYRLKLVAVTVKLPSGPATAGVEVSMLDATSILPQEGPVTGASWRSCTSLRAPWPDTPKAGVIKVCALA